MYAEKIKKDIPQKQWDAINECLKHIDINNCRYRDIKDLSNEAYNGIRQLGGFGIFRYNFNQGVYSDKLDFSDKTEEIKDDLELIEIATIKGTDDSYEDLPLPLKEIEKNYGHIEPPRFESTDKDLDLLDIQNQLYKIQKDIEFLKESLLYNNDKIKLLQEAYKNNIKEDIKKMIEQYTIITYGKNYRESLLLASNTHMINILNEKFNINIDELQIAFAKKYADNIKSHNADTMIKEEKLIPNKLVLIEKLGLLIDYYCIVRSELESVLIFKEED